MPAVVDKEKCTGCESCVEACPAEATVFGTREALVAEAHRRLREREIVALLGEGPRTVRRLARAIYPEVAPGLAEMARRQIYAHLRKLRAEGRAEGRGYTGTWRLV